MFRRHWKSLAGALCVLCFCFQLSTAQQRTGSLRGHVSDELGALVVGASVTVVSADGTQKTATTNAEGTYNFNSLTPGPYTSVLLLRVLLPTKRPSSRLQPDLVQLMTSVS